MKSGNLNFLEPSGPLQACNGTDLPFTLVILWLLWWEAYVAHEGEKIRKRYSS